MRTMHFSLLLCALAGASAAGGLDDPIVTPVMEPAVVVEEAQASSAPSAEFIMAMTTLIMFGTALGQ